MSDEHSDDLAEMPQLELRALLLKFRQEFHDLIEAIKAVGDEGDPSDAVKIQRLKKKKHAVNARIKSLEDRLLPDIIA